MLINRRWAIPNPNTFTIKPIYNLIKRVFDSAEYTFTFKAVDPFCRNSPFKSFCVTNDIDKNIQADYHIDALEFLRGFGDNSVDILLFDPPYSPRQVSECYKSAGVNVNMETTQSSFWSKLKVEASRIVKQNGAVISCGWNSGGIGKKYGFEIREILLVPHGGAHNDTIVTLDIKNTRSRKIILEILPK